MLFCAKEDCIYMHARVENLEWAVKVLEETLANIMEDDCDGLGVNLRDTVHDYKTWAKEAMARVAGL